MDLDHFGMDTITLAGPLEARLSAVRAAGFSHVMLNAAEIAATPAEAGRRVAAVRASGLRVCGFQVLRDFEGLSGHLHDYKVDVAKAMLRMCHALGSRCCWSWSSTSNHASGDATRWCAICASSRRWRCRSASASRYEALSWGRHVNEYRAGLGDRRAGRPRQPRPRLDSFHVLATQSGSTCSRRSMPEKIFLVQLADFMWQELRSSEERIDRRGTFACFPAKACTAIKWRELVRRLDEIGYRGDYSFEVFNDDYQQLPLPMVVARAQASVKWLVSHVSRGSLLPWSRRAAAPTPPAG